jgi:hypothetical protein|tara:strand:- start:1311 stop:1799 length:489 start_codon:yes stop_codon:yes gene_type:complete
MITLVNIIEKLKTYYTDHYFVKTFNYGQVDLMDLKKETLFPLIYVVPGLVSIDKGQMTYNLEIICADLLFQKENKEERVLEILSDTLRNLTDLDAEIRHGLSIFTRDEQFEVSLPLQLQPFMEEYKNVLCGYNASYAITVPYQANACIQPKDNPIDTNLVSG